MNIKGFTFAPFAPKGTLEKEEAKVSLREMVRNTGSNTVLLAPAAFQDTPQSIFIDYKSNDTLSDDEIMRFFEYAQSLGLKTILKPTVNCKNGTWRAHINFFDEDVPCEPKWSEWFEAYTEFQMHFATLAQKVGTDIFISGCEMVQTERREKEWRRLISDIRTEYHGPITYNTDKYQEHNVKWWDCVDMISSSGYYPIGSWEEQLDRIEAVVKKFEKPFFFAESGCMALKGSSKIPNNWGLAGDYAPEEQASWYKDMLSSCRKRDWIDGIVFWSWTGRLPEENDIEKHRDYDVFGRDAEKVVKEYFGE